MAGGVVAPDGSRLRLAPKLLHEPQPGMKLVIGWTDSVGRHEKTSGVDVPLN
jgi:hypothetical protein